MSDTSEKATAAGRHRNSGEGNGCAKLTEERVLAYRDRYRRGGVTIQELAAEAGVNVAGVWRAVRGLTWRHLPGAVEK